MATECPCSCNAFTMFVLLSGDTLANTTGNGVSCAICSGFRSSISLPVTARFCYGISKSFREEEQNHIHFDLFRP